MNVRLLQMAALAGLIAATGCSKDTDDDDDMGGLDAKVDTGVDGGVDDTGVDTGVDGGSMDRDTGVDTTGEEGFQCTSTLGPNDTAFMQNNCDPELLCIPWDVVAGRQMDVTGPVHSCVRPCAADADCGAGRFCRPMGFTPESGAERFCVDEVAEQDEFCGGSRTTVSRLPMVTKQTGGVMTGCPDNVTCAIGFFSDVHPDEGICVNICDDQADCANSPGTNYCNLIFRSMTSTDAAGICSVDRLGPGAICGSNDPDKVGLTRRCDNDDASPVRDARGGCVAQNLYDGAGFCGQFCGSANPCEGSDGAGPFVCTTIDATDPMFGGFCESQCTNHPDNCTQNGVDDLGAFCNQNRIVFNTDMGQVPIQFCMDRSGPPLAGSWFTLDGTAIGVQGGNCEDPTNALSFTKCPEGFYCEPIMQGQGLCFAGCARSATVAGAQGGCEVVSNTSTCARPLVNGMGMELAIGVCGDN
jgi:hypothetical protein